MEDNELSSDVDNENVAISAEESRVILAAWKRLRLMAYLFIALVLAGFISVGGAYFNGISGDEFDYGAVLVGIFAFLLVSIGLLSRKPWGRIVSFIIFILLLIGFPVGTLIGVLGLFALSRARPLYQSDGPTIAGLEEIANKNA